MSTRSEGKPGGPRNAVQFNDAGAFAGDAGLTFDKTLVLLALIGAQTIATTADDQIALILKRFSDTPAANLLELRDQDDNTLAFWDSLGWILAQRGAFGNNGVPEEGTMIRVAHSFSTDIGTVFGLDMDIETQYDADSNHAANAMGLAISSNGEFGPIDMNGFFVEVQANSNNDFSGVNGLYFAGYHTGSGNVTNLIGGYLSAIAAGSGTIENMYIGYLDLPDGQVEDVTNAYGLFIKDITVGTNRWGIYTGIGLNSFGDDLEFRNAGDGPIIKSPNGTRWRIVVDDSGNVSSELVP